jgi:hypothetical protein
MFLDAVIYRSPAGGFELAVTIPPHAREVVQFSDEESLRLFLAGAGVYAVGNAPGPATITDVESVLTMARSIPSEHKGQVTVLCHANNFTRALEALHRSRT